MKKLTAVILILIMICSLTSCGERKNTKNYEATLYFANPSKTDLVPKTKNINYEPSEILAQKVLEALIAGPESTDAAAIIPSGTELLSFGIEDGCAICNFSANIYSSVETDNILIRTSILRTLSGVEGIEKVKILVNSGAYMDGDGLEIGVLTVDGTVYDTELEDEQDKYLKLYFADKDAQKLVAEARKVTLSQKESEEMRVLKELLKGPEKNFLTKTIPDETKILSVETKEGVCFVNLSQEFISKHIGGSNSEMLTVYSIVNSLTELENVDKVQFLIEGQKTEVYIQMIFNEPFTKNDSIIN